ncbi:MAG: zinc-binding dehydrogenase [Pseudonocardiaceae bacterium]|nr:zinc-binding dehydrogenase [Pseudonocardiaceae bacterium]
MRAQQLQSFDGPNALRLVDLPIPDDPARVLIDVHAAGASFPDLLFTYGRYQDRPDLPYTPGLEVAGTVRSAPEGSGVQIGDRVAAATFGAGGGYAECAVAAPEFVFRIPKEIDFVHGAAMVVNYHTAHFSLQRRGRLRAGETLLVHGAAGGLGTAVIQVGKGLGARVIAVVSTPEKGEVARQAGADEVLRVDEGWAARAREFAGGHGVNLVYDPVGGPRFADSLRCLAPEGRLVVVGFAAGEIPTVQVNRLLLRNVDVLGAVWEPFTKIDPTITAHAGRELADMVRAGIVRPVIGSRYCLVDATLALQEVEQRQATGKVVLEV